MKFKNQTIMLNICKMENTMKIKEEVVSVTDLQTGKDFPASDAMATKNSEVAGMVIKIEIKEEPWWNEKIPQEVKYQPEASVSHLEVQNEIKGEAKENFIAAESRRLQTEAASNVSSGNEATFTIEDLKQNSNLEFEAVKVHEVYGSNSETSCSEQSVSLHKSNTLNEYHQSEKLNTCSDNREKLHRCEICDKRFYHRRNLRVHILIHEGKRPFKCDICEKSFIKMEDLRRHMLIHEGKRPHKCDVCEKTFTQGGGLKRHSLIHEGKRLYNCEVCKKSFTRKQSLKNHHLIHEGKSIYRCDVCEKSFIQMGDLKRHILIHEGKRPYKCDVCERSFTQMGGLRRHNLIHEGKG